MAIAVAALFAATAFAQTPKYVFYFIGDGMGVNQVALTEMYMKASGTGKVGIENLNFSGFPAASLSTTYSANRDVTDSAASGTALASGTKTNNSSIGIDPDGNPLESIATKAKAAGKKVAILTTTAVNDATPGPFYSHRATRKMYFDIALDIIPSGFDFFAGDGVYQDNKDKDGNRTEFKASDKIAEAGYTVCSFADFGRYMQKSDKMMLVPKGGESVKYAIDAQYVPEDKRVTLARMVNDALQFLMKDGCSQGFFMMAEGGKIDGSGHSNDARTGIEEVKDLANAIDVALAFYKSHPDETLIVLTADHETGGMTFSPYKADQLAKLSCQKHSVNEISSMLKAKIKEGGAPLSWEDTKAFLTEQFGLWDQVEVKKDQEKTLHKMYDSTIAKNEAGHKKDLYSDNAKIVAEALSIFNENCGVHWTVSGHSASYVPVYAIGIGWEKFTRKTDNAQIPRTIAAIAGY